MTQLKSQMLGLSLGLTTAIGCIFYEKLVTNFSFMTIAFLKLIEALLIVTLSFIIFPNSFKSDVTKFTSDITYVRWGTFFVLTGITSLLWYLITKKQGVMAGSLYEVKYIVMLALIYILFGDQKFNINTAVGMVLALFSVYFISK